MRSYASILLYAALTLVCFTLTSAQKEWVPWTGEWTEWDLPVKYNGSNSNDSGRVFVTTSYGEVKGYSIPWSVEYDLHYPEWHMKRINCFLGVRYASPPLRFQKPKPPEWHGVWDATHFKNACPQKLDEIHKDIPSFPKTNVSEDCLYLNIFAPNVTYPYTRPDNTSYPVIVWFHSGDFTHGTAQQQPGHVLATRGVVVVSVNYRLGALGFLTTEDERGTGNWGMYDQVQALEFIKENIAAFGGDPKQITLMGDGAGAASVGMHLVSPLSRGRGLYHKAIMMSGADLSMFGFNHPFWRPREYALELGRLLNCSTNNSHALIECLRDDRLISWETIVENQDKVEPNDGILGVVWTPTKDSLSWHESFLPLTPWEFRRFSDFNKVPMIIGINTQDGARKANETIPSLGSGVLLKTFREFISDVLDGWLILDSYKVQAQDAIEFQYTYWPEPDNVSRRSQQVIDMMTDLWYGMPMDEVIKSQCENEPTYMYQYNWKPNNDSLPDYLGVSDSAMVPYVFGVPFMNEAILNDTGLVPRQWFDYPDKNTSDWLMYLWTNFVKHGDPTPNTTHHLIWEPFNRWNLTYLIIDEHSHLWFQYRQTKYSFWRDYFPYFFKQDQSNWTGIWPDPKLDTPTSSAPTTAQHISPLNIVPVTTNDGNKSYMAGTFTMVAFLVLTLGGIGLIGFFLWRRRERGKKKTEDDEITVEEEKTEFDYSQLSNTSS